MDKASCFLASSLAFVFKFPGDSHSDLVEMISHLKVDLICISLIARDIEHLKTPVLLFVFFFSYEICSFH